MAKVKFNVNEDLSRLQTLIGDIFLSNEKLPVAARTPGDAPDVHTVYHRTSESTLLDYYKKLKAKVAEMESGEADEFVESASSNPQLPKFKRWRDFIKLSIAYKMWLREQEAEQAEKEETKLQKKEKLERLKELELSNNSEARKAEIAKLEQELS